MKRDIPFQQFFRDPSAKPLPVWLNVIFLCFSLIFMGAVFFRNLPGSVVYTDLVEPLDSSTLTPLGLYHRGWGMFPGPTTHTLVTRLRYIYTDGSIEIKDYFPLHSSLKRSVWNEVMEDLVIRDDNNDYNGYYQTGFFNYECRTLTSTGGSQLKSIAIEQDSISDQELYDTGGHPYNGLEYFTKKQYTCPAS
jgi:hypothetical protein